MIQSQALYLEVVAGILWRGERYLATQRPLHKAHGGAWEFPGGKVEEGESLESALKRELEEELGVRVLHCEHWRTVEHVYFLENSQQERRVRVHFFHIQHFEGEPVGAEGQALLWCLPEEGMLLPFLEADKPLVAQLLHVDV